MSDTRSGLPSGRGLPSELVTLIQNALQLAETKSNPLERLQTLQELYALKAIAKDERYQSDPVIVELNKAYQLYINELTQELRELGQHVIGRLHPNTDYVDPKNPSAPATKRIPLENKDLSVAVDNSSQFIASDILFSGKLQPIVLDRWLMVLKQALATKDYYTASIINLALGNGHLGRINTLFDSLDAEDKKLIEQLRSDYLSDQGWVLTTEAYRTHRSNPFVPSILGVIKNSTYSLEAQKSHAQTKEHMDSLTSRSSDTGVSAASPRPDSSTPRAAAVTSPRSERSKAVKVTSVPKNEVLDFVLSQIKSYYQDENLALEKLSTLQRFVLEGRTPYDIELSAAATDVPADPNAITTLTEQDYTVTAVLSERENLPRMIAKLKFELEEAISSSQHKLVLKKPEFKKSYKLFLSANDARSHDFHAQEIQSMLDIIDKQGEKDLKPDEANELSKIEGILKSIQKYEKSLQRLDRIAKDLPQSGASTPNGSYLHSPRSGSLLSAGSFRAASPSTSTGDISSRGQRPRLPLSSYSTASGASAAVSASSVANVSQGSIGTPSTSSADIKSESSHGSSGEDEKVGTTPISARRTAADSGKSASASNSPMRRSIYNEAKPLRNNLLKPKTDSRSGSPAPTPLNTSKGPSSPKK